MIKNSGPSYFLEIPTKRSQSSSGNRYLIDGLEETKEGWSLGCLEDSLSSLLPHLLAAHGLDSSLARAIFLFPFSFLRQHTHCIDISFPPSFNSSWRCYYNWSHVDDSSLQNQGCQYSRGLLVQVASPCLEGYKLANLKFKLPSWVLFSILSEMVQGILGGIYSFKANY